jgi:hypothetical protein
MMPSHLDVPLKATPQAGVAFFLSHFLTTPIFTVPEEA